MRWQLKASVQKTLDLLPQVAAEQLNYVLQRRVMRSFPTSEQQFFLHFDEATAHIRTFERHTQQTHTPPEGARAYEFGAGWDLIGPLSFYALGINAQVIIDISPLVRWELVNHILRLFSANHDELERRAGRPLRRLEERPIASAGEMQRRFGIDYRAPLDARDTGLAAGSFDLITSTYTLEHIPRADILAILRECHWLLSPGGVLSCSIDMQDHYAFADSRISIYNFLKYGDRAWRVVNSSLHYQNRLRAPDYLRLFERANLRLLDCEILPPDPSQRERLAALRLAPMFSRDYSSEDLAATGMLVTATAAAA